LKERIYLSGWTSGLFMKDCWLVSAFTLYRFKDAQSKFEHMRPECIIVQLFS
jgi:hypothetical protein